MSAITREQLVQRRAAVQAARDHFEKQVIAQDGALSIIDGFIRDIDTPPKPLAPGENIAVPVLQPPPDLAEPAQVEPPPPSPPKAN